MTVGQNIRRLRHQRAWYQIELGQRTGIDPNDLCKYERGKTDPSLPRLIALADAFGITLDELVGRQPPARGEGGNVYTGSTR